MATTYEPIATTTLSSAAADITFSSISSAYTDLRLITRLTPTGATFPRIQFNGDTATNYSNTRLYGDGTSVLSNRQSSITGISLVGAGNYSTTIPTFLTIDIFSYAGSTNKTVLATLSGNYNASGEVSRIVGLWRNTAAITSIRLFPLANNLATGTTATLYGILKA
jgi:hypothetical protein